MGRKRQNLCGVRHCFLQTAAGVLFAWMGGVSLGLLPYQPAWKAVVFTFAAAAAAAGIYAAMQRNGK